jgi:hypothetical protein
MKYFITTLFCLPLILLTAQSKKELKDAGVKSRTEMTSKLVKKSMVTYKESFEKYDENGNKTEVIEYDSKGDIKSYTQFEYNDKGKVTKELKIDALSKKPVRTIDFFYEEDKLTKEIVYNKKNEVTETSIYTYDGKLKLEKKTTNGSGKLIETKIYTYEKK